MKFMIDAGHGFNTPGKRSFNGMREYEFNRVVASYVKSLLETYQNVTVYFAHSDERDVPLKERTDTANRLKVEAYISIHANASGTTWNEARGIETFVYTTRPNEAVELAQKVQKYLVTMTGERNRGIKTDNFHVLRETNMTAILSECGFMTNKEDEALLESDSYRRTCAEAITRGIAEQYHLVKKSAVKADSTTAPKPALSPAPAPSSATASNASAPTASGSQRDGLYHLQVGAFTDQKNAEALASRLKAEGHDVFIDFEAKK